MEEEKTNAEKAQSFCEQCGAALNPTAKFCKSCGAKVESSSAEEVAPKKKYCRQCGAELDVSVKFCHKCGTPTDGVISPAPAVQTAAPAQGASFTVDDAVKKKRKIAALLYLIGSIISIVAVFIFMCTPFVSVVSDTFGRELEFSQTGFGLIGVAFGADSELVAVNIDMDMLRWAGWFYFLLLVIIIDHLIAFILNIFRYRKGERPFNLFQSNVSILIVAVLVLVCGCIAYGQVYSWQSEIESAGLSYLAETNYLGFVGVFVCSLVGSVVAAVAFFISFKAYPPYDRRAKKTGTALAIFIVDLVLGIAAGTTVSVPLSKTIYRRPYDYDYSVAQVQVVEENIQDVIVNS